MNNQRIIETIELLKVAFVGTGGYFATIKLADVATITSIGVGIVTITYVVAKTYFLIKHHGGEPKQ